MTAIRHIPSGKIGCVVPNGDQLGETPLWCDRSQKLWWLDIEKPKLQSLDPLTGATEAFADHDVSYLGSQALLETGGHLLGRDLQLFVRSPDGAVDHLVTIEEGLDNRLNDGRVDRFGRFWVGTMDNELHRPNGALYRVGPGAAVEKILDDVIVSNGIAFSPDGRRFHFTDTRRYRSWVFDMDPDDGEITGKRLFADYSATGDRPDGACFDVDGGLWTAFFAGGRVVRQTPDGRIDTVIELPVSNPTCLCFGGRDFSTLYITTAAKFLTADQLAAEPLAGAVFAVDGVAQGLPEHRFRI